MESRAGLITRPTICPSGTNSALNLTSGVAAEITNVRAAA